MALLLHSSSEVTVPCSLSSFTSIMAPGTGAASRTESELPGTIDKESFSSGATGDINQYTTTRIELWSYYIYYIGNNGLPGQYYVLFQELPRYLCLCRLQFWSEPISKSFVVRWLRSQRPSFCHSLHRRLCAAISWTSTRQ